jgi:hypothetical protein
MSVYELDENYKVETIMCAYLHPSDLDRIKRHNSKMDETMDHLVTRLLEDYVEKIIDDENKKTIEKRKNRCLT